MPKPQVLAAELNVLEDYLAEASANMKYPGAYTGDGGKPRPGFRLPWVGARSMERDGSGDSPVISLEISIDGEGRDTLPNR